MSSNGYQFSRGQGKTNAGSRTLKLNDREVTAEYVAELRNWVGAAESQFTDDEYRRVKQALAFAQRRTSEPKLREPRVSISSLVYLLLPLIMLVPGAAEAQSQIAELRDVGYYSGIQLVVPYVFKVLPFAVAFVCCSVLAVGLPKWTHIVALIVGIIAMLLAAGGLPRGVAWLYFLFIGWLVFMFVKGGRR